MIIASGHRHLNLLHGWRSLTDQSGTTIRLKEAISSDKLEHIESPHIYILSRTISSQNTMNMALWSNVLYQLATPRVKV